MDNEWCRRENEKLADWKEARRLSREDLDSAAVKEASNYTLKVPEPGARKNSCLTEAEIEAVREAYEKALTLHG